MFNVSQVNNIVKNCRPQSLSFKGQNKYAVSDSSVKPLEDNDALIREQIFMTKIKIKKCILRLKELEYLIEKSHANDYVISDDCFVIDKYSYKNYKEYEKLLQYNKEYDDTDEYLEDFGIFLKHLENHPKTAFLYNPDITCDEKREILNKTDNVLTVLQAAKRFHLPIHTIAGFIRTKTIEADYAVEYSIIDMDFEVNREFFAKVKKSILTNADFCTKYNYTQDEISKLVKSGELVSCSENGYVIDITDEKNVKAIEKHLKTTPLKSPKYYKSQVESYKNMVPVSYLSGLGFGKPLDLFNAVKNKKLPGRYIIKETPEGKKCNAVIDISSIFCEYALQRKRDDNENVKTIQELAKMLHLTPDDIKQALINDELEIIPEYIFGSDSRKTFIDLTKQKNIDFINKYKS